ncbi:MAG: hypothetical protein HUJ54_13450 [Erysipelotrichaceae bacterium]|nr:hypothetical protein [Erysipelotrichaceae bacterium]
MELSIGLFGPLAISSVQNGRLEVHEDGDLTASRLSMLQMEPKPSWIKYSFSEASWQLLLSAFSLQISDRFELAFTIKQEAADPMIISPAAAMAAEFAYMFFKMFSPDSSFL